MPSAPGGCRLSANRLARISHNPVYTPCNRVAPAARLGQAQPTLHRALGHPTGTIRRSPRSSGLSSGDTNLEPYRSDIHKRTCETGDAPALECVARPAARLWLPSGSPLAPFLAAFLLHSSSIPFSAHRRRFYTSTHLPSPSRFPSSLTWRIKKNLPRVYQTTLNSPTSHRQRAQYRSSTAAPRWKPPHTPAGPPHPQKQPIPAFLAGTRFVAF